MRVFESRKGPSHSAVLPTLGSISLQRGSSNDVMDILQLENNDISATPEIKDGVGVELIHSFKCVTTSDEVMSSVGIMYTRYISTSESAVQCSEPLIRLT